MSGCTEHVVPSHSWGTHQSAQCGAKCRVPRTQAVDDVTSRAVRSWSARARRCACTHQNPARTTGAAVGAAEAAARVGPEMRRN